MELECIITDGSGSSDIPNIIRNEEQCFEQAQYYCIDMGWLMQLSSAGQTFVAILENADNVSRQTRTRSKL